ncbi:AraC family transcriptional regulator [Parasedimentitalea marina]|uniref:AraC family transcriptional regulator n=1 Tax=Parasedimentitalea marina TaxID=2483033 RepID=A0A3T0MYV1_9RHOB|nr:AraC family transcriptional regulator [Parasedimentitalea marina]AZV76909.1 AraC family transcriptional regulator [Parasedimentitalea marina]
MVSNELISEVFDHVQRHDAFGTGCPTGVDCLFALSKPNTTAYEATLYEPIMCLVLQGVKEAHLGEKHVRYGQGDSLIVSHTMPAISGVIQASAAKPYVSLAIRLDLALARSLYDEIGEPDVSAGDLQSMSVAKTDAGLVDAMTRLFRLSHNPVEVRALAPLVVKEIHFRLLRAQHGGMLRQLLLHDSPASRVSKAIARIRSDYNLQIPVAELAATAGMSQSTFHEHFKTVTSSTPLQYQKELRLLEAQRLLRAEAKPVSSVAFEVGYESPTQFSREYTRKFGVTPRQEKSSVTA